MKKTGIAGRVHWIDCNCLDKMAMRDRVHTFKFRSIKTPCKVIFVFYGLKRDINLSIYLDNALAVFGDVLYKENKLIRVAAKYRVIENGWNAGVLVHIEYLKKRKT